jgi:voltage-gated potassium channel Kch
MEADLHLAVAHPMLLLGATVSLLAAKIGVCFILARIARQSLVDSVRFALALPQASEFGFVLFGAAVAVGALDPTNASIATLIAAVSMAATPVIFALSEKFLIPRLEAEPVPDFDTIESPTAPVIIAGFGRFGQIVGRVLRMHGIEFTALERDPGQVDVVRRFGLKVYFGDPARPDLMRAAGAEQAKLLVIAQDDAENVLRITEVAKRQFPHMKVLARARNRRHVYLLMDRHVDGFVRDTFFSSLYMAEQSLLALGVPATEAKRSVALFREHDERTLVRTHAFYEDERQLIQSQQQAADELMALFEADRKPGA